MTGKNSSRFLTVAATVLIYAVGFSTTAAAPEYETQGYFQPTTNDYGGVGILATRTARFHDDGQFNVSATFVKPYRRYAITLQALPWLEATFRYSDIRNRDFSLGGLQSEETFFDRGADLKFQLLEESRYLPQIAVGLQDGLGTGLFNSEYLAFSKRYYDFDFSFGVAWGLLGSRGTIENPLINLSDSFRSREGSGGLGGEANLGTFFSGETVGLFGGVQWYTPIRGLILSLEYDGNNYENEPLGNNLGSRIPLNFGATYRPFDWIELTGAFERGDTAMFRASLRSNLKTPGAPKFDPPPPKLKKRKNPPVDELATVSPISPRPKDVTAFVQPGDPVPVAPKSARTGNLDQRDASVADRRTASTSADTLFDGLEDHGLEIDSIETVGEEARVFVSRGLVQFDEQQAQAAAQVVAGSLPDSTTVTLIERHGLTEVKRVSLQRRQIEQASIVDYLFDGMEAEGYAVESIELNHREVAFYVSAMPGADTPDENEVAEIAFRTLPTPVDRAAIIVVDGGIEVSRTVLRRQDVRRAARIDQMFDGLEGSGFQVDSLELSRGRATVYVTPHDTVDQQTYEAAARLVADLAPEVPDDVVIVGLAAGVEATRVTLRRNGLSSGSDGERYIPDLTDNEKQEIALKVFRELEAADFDVDAFRITRHKATVFVTPKKFRQYARNVGRAARAVANVVPDAVEEIEVVTMSAGLETARVTIMRSDLERAVAGSGSPEEIWAGATISEPQGGLPPFGGVPDDAINNTHRYPTMSWYVRPQLRSHIGGPEGLYLYQIWLAMSAQVELYRGLSVSGTLGKNITSTLDEIELTSDSQLPRVRSDVKEYVQQGEDGNIVNLTADYMFQPFPEWFARISAGYLEEMFGGVNAEVLYRPFGSRLALGADIARVRQREFDQRFDFRNYEVTTGHFNVYYNLPWWGLLGELHIGQFLAGDRGTQFVISRQFESGMTVGGWATLTNVSAEEFGEGSFDKGFYFSIPFELFLTNSTRRRGTFAFRPLTRDGGQVLGRSKRLYGIVEDGNIDNIMHDWDRLLD